MRRGLPGRRGNRSSSFSPWRSRRGECIEAGLEGRPCLQDIPGQLTMELPAQLEEGPSAVGGASASKPWAGGAAEPEGHRDSSLRSSLHSCREAILCRRRRECINSGGWRGA